MDTFNIIAGIASILGLGFSVWAVLITKSVKKTLLEAKRRRINVTIFREVLSIPATVETLTVDQRDRLQQHLQSLREQHFPKASSIYSEINLLAQELQGQRRLPIIRDKIRLILVELENH